MKLKFLLLAFLCSSFLFGQENNDPLIHWWHKDLENDSIPGIGLDRAYEEILPGKEWHEVIVAVLDTKMDIDHEELKDQIWINEDEIPGNGIDDDQNGFVDDVNGWNFLGNAQGGEVEYQLVEEIRVIRQYEKAYSATNGDPVDSASYKVYMRAKESLADKKEESLRYYNITDSLYNQYLGARDTLRYMFKGDNYSEAQLDSLGKAIPGLSETTDYMARIIKFGVEEKDFSEFKEQQKIALDSMYNPNSDDRINVSIGNNKVKNNNMDFQHATPVAAVIAANRSNAVGLKGISDKIRIMPIVMVADGDEHDEDVAKAIRYAVDNGAHIINMSWGKYFSSLTHLVRDAFEYAAAHDVLMISAAGNDGKDIDLEVFYPTDYFDYKERFENFINAGGVTHLLDSTIVASFSNYGQDQVDLFAPAEKIFSADPENEYSYTGGTSFASPMIAGSAALLKGYYPDLKASDIKEILLNSGDAIDLLVVRPGADKDEPLVPFASLSKTGKILNVYRALLMAEEINSK